MAATDKVATAHAMFMPVGIDYTHTSMARAFIKRRAKLKFPPQP